MTAIALPQQPRLTRPVCMDAHAGECCTLLAGHEGKHTSARGKQW